MKVVQEFEVWSRPGMVFPQDYGKDLQEEIWGLGVPRDVFLGVSNIPDETDVVRLRLALDRREVELSQFSSFCEQLGLDADLECQSSASRFMEFSFGRVLAWVHIPEGGDERHLLQQIKSAIESRGFVLVAS